MNEKKELFDNISQKLGYEKNELKIDEALLKYLTNEELNEIDSLIEHKKTNSREKNLEFLDNLYQKTKKDKI